MAVRLGGPIFENYKDPEEWVSAVQREGYRAAICPVGSDASDDLVKSYEAAAREADILISEVGAWSNPLSPDEKEGALAIQKCRASLDLADRIGASCCVNISGSCSTIWDGPHPGNLTPETFDRIVQITRDIIDTVKPKRTFFALEAMPWTYPTGPKTYLKLIRAIDRKQFAVHLDPVNMIWSPERCYAIPAVLRECFDKLGLYIKSCHAKDVRLDSRLTVHIDEVPPGEGLMDYGLYLREVNRLSEDVGLLLEHLPDAESYRKAAAHLRSVAKTEHITL